MNLQEYIANKLKMWHFHYPAVLIDTELKAMGAEGSTPFTGADFKVVDLFLWRIIPELLLGAHSFSQGGFSVSFDRGAVLDYYRMLCQKLGKPNILEQQPKVKDISHLF